MTAIVDGPYMTYRAFCAGGIEATYRYTLSVLLDLLRRHNDVWVAWENRQGKGPELRRNIYPDYKARREPKPPEYLRCLSVLFDVLPSFGMHQAWPVTGEADDAALVLTDQAVADGHRVELWGRDKDWFQLLTRPGSTMTLPPARSAEGGKSIAADNVPELLGVPAHLVPAYLALAGDSSDDVPGMPRIGAQRAARLLEVCPDLVSMVVDGSGDEAVAIVLARDVGLASYAQGCADNAPLLRQMLDLVVLRPVELERVPGRCDPAAAAEATAIIGCEWAAAELDKMSKDAWCDDITPVVPPLVQGTFDDWGE